ncbi:hypothetical protein MNBD_CHLOROFLEXI01-3628 [hydrothermal vent metagenome]|uniref:Uncharacterized protein n=1 Tax=hydrothermal vent metagenome TaxID=652676 RepID=A0A3B0URH0_9ZZZZ
MVCHTCEGRYPSFPTRLDSRLRGNDILSFQPKMSFGEGIVTQSDAQLCPQPILDIEATLASIAPHYATAALSVLAKVENNSEVLALPTVLQGWVSAEEAGLPLDTGTIAERPLPSIVPGESSNETYLEIYMPINLAPAEYFVVLRTRPDTHSPESGEPRTTISFPFTITSCIEGTLYCDVGLEYWANSEIKTWYDLGMSKGCRSGTEEFVNRPFCPSVLLDRAHFLIFLIRHQFDPDHVPSDELIVPYADYYIDVSSDYGLHRWI